MNNFNVTYNIPQHLTLEHRWEAFQKEAFPNLKEAPPKIYEMIRKTFYCGVMEATCNIVNQGDKMTQEEMNNLCLGNKKEYEDFLNEEISNNRINLSNNRILPP